MTDALGTTGQTPSLPSAQHPLEPLTAEEITLAVQIVRNERHLSNQVRFVSVTLHEPLKSVVLNFKPGEPITREAFMVLLDNMHEATYETIVSITERRVVSWEHIPGVQPSILLGEFFEFEPLVKAHPDFQAAMQKRGITNMDLVMVESSTSGNYGAEEEQTRRIMRGLVWLKLNPHDNSYAHPVEGVQAIVDLHKMEVIRIEDNGVIPVPPEAGNYTSEAVGQLRADLKPLEIIQPEGPSFSVNGHEVSWQKWRFRIGFTPREGLVLYTISYEDQGRIRPIIYRASLAEMVIPYGDPSQNRYHQNAFDLGEYGIGKVANALELGCDCLGSIYYFDATMSDDDGNALTLPNAVCMHEEDYGILWKHFDLRTNQTEVRRSRRLVVSFIATVGNYEYGFFWYFYQDGTIQYEAKLTGIVNTGAVPPGETPRYGRLVAPQLNALNHQHFFNIRLDMMVDGLQNSVYEVHTEAEPLSESNPYGNAFYAQAALLSRELEAQQVIDPLCARNWKVVNPSVTNKFGQPVAYKLLPGENVLPFAHHEASISKRAAFMTKHLWVTPFSARELYPAGDYPNQHSGGAGLPAWTQANRSIENTNVVLWYTMGAHHIVRPEDWPVMPVSTIGFTLKPDGFFDRNPALDVPPPHHHGQDHCHA
ncbi:MAG TPA: primary-amine oxidase [Ktedonobacteraceae bacterium]|nr:primary-amine oxidase [Ktedonobacteraceae bacterium]